MALIENRHGRSPRSPSIRWQLFLLGAGCSACCFVRPIALFPWQGTSQRRRRGALAAAATSVEEVFAVLKDELSNCTPLADELSVVLGCGREFLESLPVEDQERGLELFREMTEWQKMQRGSRQSLGPLAVSALLHPESGREIILVGTPHSLPGAVAVTNPVPKAVQRTVKALKPELVAVELDEARGVRELEKRPKLRGQSPILLPDSEGSPLQGLFQIFSQPELGLDEELLQRIRAKAGSRLSVKGYLRALRQIYAKSSEKCLAMNVFALDELRAEGDGDWGQDATAAVLAAQRAELPILFCDLPQEWTLGKVIPIYNKEWVAARGKRLKFLEDLDVATRFLQAEEAMIREAVMSGHGGDLPSLDYGLGLCRPAVGFAEAATRRLWLEERDPAMANAVTSALEGRARVLEGKHSRLEAKQRAVLQVGCCHVEGIVKSLQQHGYKVVPEPQGGWPDLTSKGKVPVRTKKTSRQSKNVRSKPRAAGFA